MALPGDRREREWPFSSVFVAGQIVDFSGKEDLRMKERERGVKSILTICCQSKTLLSPLGSINLASSTFYLYIGVDKGLYEVNEIEYSLFSRLPLLLNSCHNFSIHPKKLRRNKISKTLFFSFHGTGLKNFAFFSSFIQTMGKNLGE